MEKITEYTRNKEAYIRKSHSFTKESLEDLGILSRYMGDIGESAVLRYLIINEIRKVPSLYAKPLYEEDAETILSVMHNTVINHQKELAKRGLPSVFPEGLKEDELAKVSAEMKEDKGLNG
jgi:hypothetical protein